MFQWRFVMQPDPLTGCQTRRSRIAACASRRSAFSSRFITVVPAERASATSALPRHALCHRVAGTTRFASARPALERRRSCDTLNFLQRLFQTTCVHHFECHVLMKLSRYDRTLKGVFRCLITLRGTIKEVGVTWFAF